MVFTIRGHVTTKSPSIADTTFLTPEMDRAQSCLIVKLPIFGFLVIIIVIQQHGCPIQNSLYDIGNNEFFELHSTASTSPKLGPEGQKLAT